MQLERFGQPTTWADSLRGFLGLPVPERAPLVQRGERVRVILQGEERVAPGRFAGTVRRRRGRVRVVLDDVRATCVSRVVTVERKLVLKGD